MSKLISKLPEDVRLVALQRQREETNYAYNDKADYLCCAFIWVNTPEGLDIWRQVADGNYEPFREFHANLKQPENNGWISVEERLPSIDEDDVFNKEHKISKPCLVWEGDTHYFGVYHHVQDSWVVYGRLGNINVTHWQPLPEPPKN